MTLFTKMEGKKTIKICVNQKRPQIVEAHMSKKNNKGNVFTIHDFKMYYRIIASKQYDTDIKTI